MTSRVVRWLGVTVPVVALAFGGWAFAQEPPKKPEPPKPPPVKPEEKKIEAPKVEPKMDGDILGTAMSEKLVTFIAMVKIAGLDEALKGEGPFTVFAPTDEAWKKWGDLEALKADKAKLAEILKGHVVKGKMMAADVTKAKDPLKTLKEKTELTVTTKDGKVMLNGKAAVVKPDITAKNGVIHTIDTVLAPAAPAVEKKPEMKPEEKKPAEKKPEEKKP